MKRCASLNAIQKYFKYRQSLIDQYVKGDMTKQEYLDGNLEAVLSLQIRPFQNVDTVEKGLFNYQYYNAMAKEAAMTAHRAAGDGRLDLLARAGEYYDKKDRATLKVLRLLDFQRAQAYFIKTRSSQLSGKLYEIVIEDYQMILHSTSPVILRALREESVFSEGVRQSLIDGYINQKY